MRQGTNHIALEKEGAVAGSGSRCLDGEGPLMVAFDDAAAILPDQGGQGGSGIDLGRGTDHHEQVAVGDEGMDRVEIPHRFAERTTFGLRGNPQWAQHGTSVV